MGSTISNLATTCENCARGCFLTDILGGLIQIKNLQLRTGEPDASAEVCSPKDLTFIPISRILELCCWVHGESYHLNDQSGTIIYDWAKGLSCS